MVRAVWMRPGEWFRRALLVLSLCAGSTVALGQDAVRALTGPAGDRVSVVQPETGLSSLFAGSGQTLLPPEQAFPMSYRSPADDVLAIRWETVAGYYLYQERFAFDGGDGLVVAGFTLPDAEVIDDPYFGRMPVYRQPVELYLQFAAPPENGAVLTATYQGCAEAGLCYPPMTARFEAVLGTTGLVWRSLDGASLAADGIVPASTGPSGGPFAAALRQGGVWAVLSVFFVAGLGLALTACMYPLIPILSGLIAGDHRRSSGRALLLSLTFVQGSALTYAVIGVLAGLTGAALQALLQNPLVLGAFALVFVAMALSMFGVFTIQLPGALQTRIDGWSRRQSGGRFAGAAVMGALSALLVGACSAPALIAALAFISSTGDAVFGGFALFVMANGMGVPLLLVGSALGRWLPSAGVWMHRVRQAFGFVFLAVAVWMLARFLPEPVILAGWGLLLGAIAVWLALVVAGSVMRWPARVTALLMGAWGVALLAGALLGARDPLRPIANFDPDVRNPPAVEWQAVASSDALRQALLAAREQRRPVVIDVYADWCVYCVQLERYTFTDPRVVEALQPLVRIKVDVTAMDPTSRQLLADLGVFLPPALLFLGADGVERGEDRLSGFVAAPEFLETLRRVPGAGSVVAHGGGQ